MPNVKSRKAQLEKNYQELTPNVYDHGLLLEEDGFGFLSGSLRQGFRRGGGAGLFPGRSLHRFTKRIPALAG